MKRLLLFLLVTVAVAGAGVLLQQDASGEAGYVGADVCRGCHEAYYESYRHSVHGRAAVPGSPAAAAGCEACHGPGAAHVQSGGGRGTGIFAFDRKTDPEKKAAQCLSCHGESRHLALWNLSMHQSADVSCDQCHSSHFGGHKNLKAAEPNLCFDCHRSINFQVNKQSHHPLREGKIMCSSCHDPHGALGQNMIKADSVNDLCYKCHADKRGPFMWDHPPVEENCLTCHRAHGSNHQRLLDKKLPELCQSCHDWSRHPGTPYTKIDSFESPIAGRAASNKLVGRSCLNCHTNIHGSNGPATNGLRFVR